MAARHLADAAVLVAPTGRGRRLPVFYSSAVGAVEQSSVDADPAAVAGLSEALHGFPAGVLGLDRPDLGTRLACSARFPGPGRVRDDPDAAGARRFGGGIGGLLRRIDRPTYGADEELFAGLFAARAPVRPCPLRGSTPSRPPSPAR
jgi:hypothetical protein